MENQRVLVTGATGQVARPLAEYLNRNNEVWAAARFSDPKAKEELEAQGIHTAYFSLGDPDLSALPEVDYVFHLGCNTDPQSPEEGILQNVEGTGFLMTRYRDVKAFFHMSSSSIYAAMADPRTPVKETDELGGEANYNRHYPMTKQSAEAVVRFLARHLELPTIIARLDVAYGYFGHGGAPMALVEFMKHGIPYHSAANGESFCSPIHQDDIARQVERLIEHAAVPAPIVNLGGDEVVSMEEMLRYLEQLTGLEARVETREQATWGMTVLDNTLRKQLAGPCEVSWREGVRAVAHARYPDLVAAP